MHDFFKDDYNLNALTLVRPAGDGFAMNVAPRFASAYIHGYEVLSTRIVKMHLARKDLFIDVGAHYGYYSLLAAEANKNIQIIAIEPIEENFKILQKNLEHNGIGNDRATCINAAVSSKAGRLQFYKSKASDNSSIYPHPSSETIARIEVDTVCLDDLIDKVKAKRIFIKTDTDGHELEVLRGLARTLDTCDDVTILLEMNPKMMRIAGTSSRELINHLQDKGFRLFAIDDTEARFYPMDNAVNVAMMESMYEKSYYNVLCIKKTKALSVLFFSHFAGLGGAERSLLDLIRGLSERGALCTAVLPSQGPLRDALMKLGCAVYVPSGGTFQGIGWWWANINRNSAKTALVSASEVAMDVIVPEIRKIAPDVIFSQTIVSPWGAICAEALKIPHTLSAREYGELDHNLSFALGFKQSMAALYETSNAVFCITSDVKNILFDGDVDKKTDVVYSSIQIPSDQMAIFDGGLKGVVQSVDNPVPTIGVFGAVVKGKGQSDLICACIELSNRGVALRCILSGSITDKVYADALKQDIEASGYSDRFIWSEFTNDPYALMRKMDVIVSCAKKEALGRTLIEASLLSKPIIYANSGGPKEVFVNGKHGLAYEPGNHIGLANAIEAVINDKAAAEARAQNAREYVLRRFTDDTYAGKIYARLRQIAQQNSQPNSNRMAVSILMSKAGIGSMSTGIVQPKMFYSDDVNSFSESQVVFSSEMPFGHFTSTFELPNSGYLLLRFDPTQLHAVTLTIYALIITTEDGAALAKDDINIQTNGERINELAWKFRTLDPQVTLKLKARAKHVQIIGELKKVSTNQLIADIYHVLADRDGQISRQKEVIAITDQQLADRNAQIATLNQSIADRASQLAVEQAKSIKLSNQIQLIQSSVSYRMIQKLRSFGWLTTIYRRLKPALVFFKHILRKKNIFPFATEDRIVIEGLAVDKSVVPGREPILLTGAQEHAWGFFLKKLDLALSPTDVLGRLSKIMTENDKQKFLALLDFIASKTLNPPAERASGRVMRAADFPPVSLSSEQRRNILFVCGEFPNPLHGGGAHVADYIKILSQNNNIYLYACFNSLDDAAARSAIGPYCKRIKVVSIEEFERGHPGRLKDFIVDIPMDIIHYAWPRSLINYDRELAEHHIFTYIEATSLRLFMDMAMDAPLSAGWLRLMIDVLNSLKIELLDTAAMDAHIVLTRKDGEFLSRFTPGRTYVVINHGINWDEYSLPDRRPDDNTVVFVGNFLHYPNEDAVVFFFDRIYGLIKERVPDIIVYIVGAHPTPTVKAYHDGRHVFVTGTVKDVRPYIQKAAVCIAPLINGAGFRTKVIQSAALRRVSVATSIAAEDLVYQDGKDVFIADAPALFAERVAYLLHEPGIARRMSEAAYETAHKYYDKRLAIEGLYRLYAHLDSTRRFSQSIQDKSAP